MTPRFVVLFLVVFAVVVFGEWYQFLRGFNTSIWTFGNWLTLVFVLLAEAIAVGIITVTVDRALPAAGNRALTKEVKQSRRGSQRYTPR